MSNAEWYWLGSFVGAIFALGIVRFVGWLRDWMARNTSMATSPFSQGMQAECPVCKDGMKGVRWDVAWCGRCGSISTHDDGVTRRPSNDIERAFAACKKAPRAKDRSEMKTGPEGPARIESKRK